MLAVPTCPLTCTLLCMKGSKKTSTPPFSRSKGKCVSHTLGWGSTRYLPEANKPSTPKPSPLKELWHWTDLDFPVYLLYLHLWMCCSRCHSDNMWMKLSLTLPLRKDIQVQTGNAILFPGFLSMIKLILQPWPHGPLKHPSVWGDRANRQGGWWKKKRNEWKKARRENRTQTKCDRKEQVMRVQGTRGLGSRGDLGGLICL